MLKHLLRAVSYIGVFIIGFAAGMYMLPILTAPPSPSAQALESHAQRASYHGNFIKNLPGSDAFHYGVGDVRLTSDLISFEGKLSPGPDYHVYLANRFIDNEADFLAYKGTFTRVASVNTFDNFLVKIPQDVDIKKFNTVIVWCESFDEFISAAKYQ
ncbi:DM13 domain-containing protein [Pseudoalteromonas sp. H105]|uniref:DM13 domain-containing protein n=1 Tax=Pseudoalteromonas sp. H105 TaxID=1348393 RepID=UPI0007324325|nr:DM13 domain-containing protein [Pseudoalteromonas sp. H105]KTF16639.1 hypothetical protein ATS75_04095 [Pseudoalteromonas sp. H105]